MLKPRTNQGAEHGFWALIRRQRSHYLLAMWFRDEGTFAGCPIVRCRGRGGVTGAYMLELISNGRGESSYPFPWQDLGTNGENTVKVSRGSSPMLLVMNLESTDTLVHVAMTYRGWIFSDLATLSCVRPHVLMVRWAKLVWLHNLISSKLIS